MKPGSTRTLLRLVVVFSCVVALVMTALVGWRAYHLLSTAIPVPADADIPVPDSVPARVTYPDKSGGIYADSGPGAYRWGFRQGWEQCVEDYRSGRFNPDITKSEVVTQDEPKHVSEARQDGYMACAAEVRKRMGR